MKDYGFIRVAAAVPRVKVADVKFNVGEIKSLIDKAFSDEVSVVVFPELSVTGYTCADLFGQTLLLREAEEGVRELASYTQGKALTAVVGVPVSYCGRLYNCAAVLKGGRLHGLVPKTHLPSYNEFYESRWFSSGSDFACDKAIETISYADTKVSISPNLIFHLGETALGIEICEDLWTPVPPSSYLTTAGGAQLILNLSASNEVLMKDRYRKDLIDNQSARTVSGYVYCSCGFGESTQDLVYAGSAAIAENGTTLAQSERFLLGGSLTEADIDIEKLDTLRRKQTTFGFSTPDGQAAETYRGLYRHIEIGETAQTDFEAKLLRHVEAHPFVPGGDPLQIDERSREITSIQVAGLATRLSHIGCRKAVIGISGGLDSTLALIVTCLAFDRLGIDRKGIIGITMPGFGTTERTHDNASDLMAALGVSSREVSIVPAVKQHFADIEQDSSVHDVTYENSQARERTQILMDVANKENAIVVGTGDLSELALGWATYNGDHMSMYAVNASVPKTLVKYLVKWAAAEHFSGSSRGGRSAKDILLDIVDTPISPELIPADSQGHITQKTEDLVGPYELHDFFLYNFFRLGYSPSKVLFLARKAFLGHKADASVFVGPEGKTNQYDEATIRKWLKKFYWRFFSQQFKRSCIPDGPKVGSVSLSPRGDWRMPSDASAALWTEDF